VVAASGQEEGSMKLMPISTWQAKHFADGGAPDEVTVRRLLRQGKLPGRKVGGVWYIDEAEWLADGDELVRRVLDQAS